MFTQWVCNYHGNTSVYLLNNATQAATNINEAHLVRDSPTVEYIILVSFTFKNQNANLQPN
jgi:dTDP-4-amino-4,6-dideoxygalactose transaminase